MDYREYRPCARLRPFIRCYWTLRANVTGEAGAQRVFPDGSMELIFHLGEPFSQRRESGAWERQAHSLLAGQIWAPIDLAATRCADVVGVRFQPAGAWPFFRFPLTGLGGRIESLEDVWGRSVRLWRDRLGEAQDRLAALEDLLLARAPNEAPEFPALCERQYRRRFRERVGVTPKLMARIQRFQQALRRAGTTPLASVAAECGYADQSHLVRDFRQFAGMPPSQWLRSREDVRFFQDALEAESLD
ncbi:MAG: AraC family transcriptional regulator [Acidobacteria bacterium]|nr:AraC family transcriptional regulator [Acidobacteriota bacterium]